MNRAHFLFIGLILVIQLVNMSFSSKVSADDLTFRSNFHYEKFETDSINKLTGQSTSFESSRFNQRYNLEFSKTIYPFIYLDGGALYELNNTESTSQGAETEQEQTLLRPFVNFHLTNPIYRGGVGYRRTQRKNKGTGISDSQIFRDEYNTFLGWFPDKLPEMRLYYLYTHTYNDPKTTDTNEKLLTFNSSYNLGKELKINYDYTSDTTENSISGTETLVQDHNGRINYSHSFLNQRLYLSTSYNTNYNTFEFERTGNVESPLLRSAGLLSLDNTPDDGPALNSNPALIDGNLTASAGINLGLNGDETILTNIGLDFGFSVSVNKIHIWVDRSLPQSIVNSFSWSVYTSPDNTDTSTWSLVATVSPASFGSIDNRFEITFSTVQTQFIKVVTRPLPSALPGASAFPDIFVTEMQAFTLVSGATIENKFTRTDHRYNLGLTGKISDKAQMGYNMFYASTEQEPNAVKRTDLSNSVFLSYRFNRVFSGRTSLSRLDRRSNDEKDVIDDFAASLTASYMETLGQVLSYSGTRTSEQDGDSSMDSLLLRTNVTLYKGWSAFLDLGYNKTQDLGSPKITSTIIQSGTNIVPNDKITININYSITESQESNGGSDKFSRSQLDLQAFFIPFRTLSFNARLSELDLGDSKTTLYNYSANWSPFPDGALQFFFTYNEILRPEDESKGRAIAPGLRWIVSRHFTFDMSYNISESESKLEENKTKGFTSNLRIIF